MSASNINYKEFVNYVHNHFKDRIEHVDLEALLQLGDDYNRDSPNSLGKSLHLERLIFSGVKMDKTAFQYDKQLFSGINVWIADNHKGKSTIFKVIKLALTGTDTIKKDIRPWIEEIILGFSVGKASYTCYIDRTGRDSGALYRITVEEFLQLQQNKKLDSLDKKTEFEFKSNKQFEEKIQDFFFEQFSFYTLKYTSKSGAKDEFKLNVNNLSWTTYFKSIYLESSNYDFLFFDNEGYGSQGKRIFEMILGLPLTYPINMLSLQLDKVMEEIGKRRLIENSTTRTSAETKRALEDRYNEVQLQLNQGLPENLELSDKSLLEEYRIIQEIANELRRRYRIAHQHYQGEKNKLSPLEQELYELSEDKKKITAELLRLGKNEMNMELYRQTESFFSNLEIKTCPHCEIAVSEEKKKQEHVTHQCSLCGETPTEQKVEDGELQIKSAKIREEIKIHNVKLIQIEKDIEQKKIFMEQLEHNISTEYDKLVSIPSVDIENEKLVLLEEKINQINKSREEHRDLITNREKLIQESAILDFRIKEINKEGELPKSSTTDRLLLEKEILEYSLLSLGKKRIQLNADILSKLQDLILKEVNSFGLVSIERVEIDDKLNLQLTQHGVKVGFSDLEPGEKLRAKLAFYLSLIQMDIEHSLGRHPRFLIFDSPGSEEMVPKHLHGLSDMFKSINTRFKDHLQIFVGSALREFEEIAELEKTVIKGDDEFMF